MKKETTMVMENEAMETVTEVQETEEAMPKKGFFTKVGEGIDAGIKKAAPVAKKVGKGAILVGAGAAAVIAGVKLKGGKSTESADYDEVEAEEFDTKYAIEDDAE